MEEILDIFTVGMYGTYDFHFGGWCISNKEVVIAVEKDNGELIWR